MLTIAVSSCKERPSKAVQTEQARKEAQRQTTEQPPKQSLKSGVASEVKARLRGCTTANVQAVVKARRPDVIRCYRKLLRKQPRATGRLAVEIHIDISGRAKFLGVQNNSFNDEDFAQCVFDVLRPLEYPVPEKEPCVVVYPFSFVK